MCDFLSETNDTTLDLNMSVTLKEIAQRAGVDPTVVSAVLRGSGRGRCSQKTKEKILALVEEMGYCRNSVASALRSGKTRLIGVAMPSPHLPFFAAMMTSIHMPRIPRQFPEG